MTDNMDRAIGRIEGKLDSLCDTVAEQGKNSRESRKDLYTKLVAIDRKIDQIDGRVAATEEKQKISDATTKFVEKIKNQAIGIAVAVSFAYALLGSAITVAAYKIMKYFGYSA